MRNTYSLTQGKLWPTLLRFSLPFLFANFLQALYGAVDLMVVSWYCSPQSIAAVSTGTQVTQIITSLISGLSLGATVLVAKYIGRNQRDKVNGVVRSTIASFAIFSVILTVALLFSIFGILRLLQTPQQSFDEAYSYVFLCCVGIFFISEYNALSAVLRGYGDSLSPLIFVAIACVCNIIGDFFTVAYLNMGVAGTAVSTVVSQGVSVLAAVIYLKRRGFVFGFSLSRLLPEKAIVKELVIIGIPVSLQECMVRFSFLYLTAITNSLGVFVASAVGIAGKYDVFAMMPATSVSSALIALTAQNLAAGKPERAKKFLKYGTLCCLGCSLIFFAWAQIAPQNMISLFSNQEQVLAQGVPFIRTCSLDYLAVSILFCMNGYLSGKEKTMFTMLNCCGGALLVRVPLLSLLTGFGVDSMLLYGLVSPISSLIMLLVIFIYNSTVDKKAAPTPARLSA